MKCSLNDYGKEKGLEIIQGPWGFDDADREGMLTYGYEEYSSYATAYSFPYYKEHMETIGGWEKESEWVENRLDPENTDPRFPKVAEMLRKRGYRDLSDTMKPAKIVKKYADPFFDCYNKAYAELDNFVAVDEKQKKSIRNQEEKRLKQKKNFPFKTNGKNR